MIRAALFASVFRYRISLVENDPSRQARNTLDQRNSYMYREIQRFTAFEQLPTQR